MRTTLDNPNAEAAFVGCKRGLLSDRKTTMQAGPWLMKEYNVMARRLGGNLPQSIEPGRAAVINVALSDHSSGEAVLSRHSHCTSADDSDAEPLGDPMQTP